MPHDTETTHKFPDAVTTDNGKVVRVATANPELRIRIKGHSIKVKDIPLTAGELGCGHIVRGIAFEQNDLVFCEEHGATPLQTSVNKIL